MHDQTNTTDHPALRLALAPLLLAVLALLVMAACGDRPALEREPAARRAGRADRGDRNGAHLVATGARAFDGASRAVCTVHDESGLQVALRTADPELPTVALRIERFGGEGAYSGRAFLTARGPTGALVRSAGTVRLEVTQQALPDAAAPVAAGRPVASRTLLSGTFEGSYEGEAGRGTVRGRFGPCLYAPPLRGPLPQDDAAIGGP